VIFHPVILALLVGSLLTSFLVLYSAAGAYGILRRWDPASGSAGQLALERKTYLLSTILGYVFGFEVLSFFLFIFAADELSSFFTGAMCAAGSLHVNAFGYPALLVRAANLLFAGVWLVLNFVDTRVEDYPLVRKKYAFFLFLAPAVLVEAVLQANYFLRLRPDLITSCCGTLFRAAGDGSAGGLGAGPGRTVSEVVFYGVMALAVGSGLHAFWRGRGVRLAAGASLLALVAAVFAIITFISPYIYELPGHHCPFCLLQREYGYIGYPLYALLFGGAIAGLSAGVLAPFRGVRSLAGFLPGFQRRLALAAAICFFLFTAFVTVRILLSHLISP
jgi:hypothetical protein